MADDLFSLFGMDDCDYSAQMQEPSTSFGFEPLCDTAESRNTEMDGYPETWQPFKYGPPRTLPRSHYEIYDLLQGSPEYEAVSLCMTKDLSNELRKHVKIGDIQRIQNAFLWQRYSSMSRDMGSRGIQNEMSLMHGTSQEAALKICSTGLNRSYCGKNGTVYGQGVYFSQEFVYASHPQYAQKRSDGTQTILLCKVLAGFSSLGTPNMKEPPVLPSGVRCDSTSDPSKNIIVTFHDDQSYPEYIVNFVFDVERPKPPPKPPAAQPSMQVAAALSTHPGFLNTLHKAMLNAKYIPAFSFRGSIAGFVFKVGENGRGYYQDPDSGSYKKHVADLIRALPAPKTMTVKRMTVLDQVTREDMTLISSGALLVWYKPSPSADLLDKDTIIRTQNNASMWDHMPWVSPSPTPAPPTPAPRRGRKRGRAAADV